MSQIRDEIIIDGKIVAVYKYDIIYELDRDIKTASRLYSNEPVPIPVQAKFIIK